MITEAPTHPKFSDLALVRIGRATAALTGVLTVVAFVTFVAGGETWALFAGNDLESAQQRASFIGLTLFAAGVFALAVPRAPRNGALWALGLAAFSSSLESLSNAAARAAAGVETNDVLAKRVIGAPADLDIVAALGLNVGLWIWVPLTFGFWVFFALLFPDGRLVSPRWRWVLWLAAIGMLSIVLMTAWAFRPWSTEPYAAIQERVSGGMSGLTDLVLGLLFLGTALTVVAALVGLVVKWRRAEGEARLQFRWVGWALILSMAAIFLPSHGVAAWAGAITGALLILSLGVAITKYRLYDVDLVISRTFVYGALALFIGAVYVGVVAITGSTLAGGESPNAVLTIGATALIAVAFQPLRRRLERLANRLVYGKRATPYEVLANLSRGVAASDEQLIDVAARSLVEGTRATAVVVRVAAGGSSRVAAMWPDEENGGNTPTGDSNDLVIPVLHDGEEFGSLTMKVPHGDRLNDEEEQVGRQVAARMGLTLKNQQLTETLRQRVADLRNSRRRIVAVQNDTRRQLERDLHDGAQQLLVALKVKLGLATQLARRDGAFEAETQIAVLSDEAQGAIDELRDFARGVYPPLLESEGLGPALTAQALRVPIPVTLEADGIGRYSEEVESTVYFCVLEALQNTARNGGATATTVSLAQNDGTLLFEVSTEGDGSARNGRRSGFTNMLDRVDAVEGTLQLDSSPDSGTTVRGTVPVAVGARP